MSCIVAAAVVTIHLHAAMASSSKPTIRVTGDMRAGHITVHWRAVNKGSSGAEYQLQESTDPNFLAAAVRYQGADRASVLSGLPDGARYYRVRFRRTPGGAWSSWSKTLRVMIHHYSRTMAASLFGLGALVFTTVCLPILVPACRTKTQQDRENGTSEDRVVSRGSDSA